MSELQEKKGDIESNLKKIKKELDSFDAKEPSERDKSLHKIDKLLKQTQALFDEFKYDIIEAQVNSSVRESVMNYDDVEKDIEKRLEELGNNFHQKKDPNYALKLQIQKEAGRHDAGSNDKVFAQAERIQQQGTTSLQNTLGLIAQTNVIADDIMLDQEKQMEQLQKALITVKDTRSKIQTANGYVKYFAVELKKDKTWRCLMIVLIIVLGLFVWFRFISNSNNVEDAGEDVLNGND